MLRPFLSRMILYVWLYNMKGLEVINAAKKFEEQFVLLLI